MYRHVNAGPINMSALSWKLLSHQSVCIYSKKLYFDYIPHGAIAIKHATSDKLVLHIWKYFTSHDISEKCLVFAGFWYVVVWIRSIQLYIQVGYSL